MSQNQDIIIISIPAVTCVIVTALRHRWDQFIVSYKETQLQLLLTFILMTTRLGVSYSRETAMSSEVEPMIAQLMQTLLVDKRERELTEDNT